MHIRGESIMTDDQTYTITETAKMTGYETHVIRFYEKEFNLQIPRNKSGHRYFTPKEMNQLENIKKLQEKGYSNTQIKMLLSNPELLNHSTEDIKSTAITNATAVLSNYTQQFDDYFIKIRNEIIEEIRTQFEFQQLPYRMALTELTEEVKELLKSMEIHSQERVQDDDVTLCENAKLKMQLKQKTYELVDLKEQLKYEKGKSKLWWKK